MCAYSNTSVVCVDYSRLRMEKQTEPERDRIFLWPAQRASGLLPRHFVIFFVYKLSKCSLSSGSPPLANRHTRVVVLMCGEDVSFSVGSTRTKSKLSIRLNESLGMNIVVMNLAVLENYRHIMCHNELIMWTNFAFSKRI